MQESAETLWERSEKLFREKHELKLIKQGYDGYVALMYRDKVIAICRDDEEAARKKLKLVGPEEECTLHDIGTAKARSVLRGLT